MRSFGRHCWSTVERLSYQWKSALPPHLCLARRVIYSFVIGEKRARRKPSWDAVTWICQPIYRPIDAKIMLLWAAWRQIETIDIFSLSSLPPPSSSVCLNSRLWIGLLTVWLKFIYFCDNALLNCYNLISNGNRTVWSPIRSVIFFKRITSEEIVIFMIKKQIFTHHKGK